MLLATLIRKIESELSSLPFVVDEDNHQVIIPPIHEGFGNLEIEDDIDELIVFVGNFTHWHAGCYDERLSEEEKAIEIAEAVMDFLRDVVNDQIVLWRSPEGGGGFDRLESLQRPFNPHQKWLWSGPIGHHLLP
jgi:hypothetical protein